MNEEEKQASEGLSPIRAMIAHFRETFDSPAKREIAQLKKCKNTLKNLMSKHKITPGQMCVVFQEKGGKLSKKEFCALIQSFAVVKPRPKRKDRPPEDQLKPTAPGVDAQQDAHSERLFGDQDTNGET